MKLRFSGLILVALLACGAPPARVFAATLPDAAQSPAPAPVSPAAPAPPQVAPPAPEAQGGQAPSPLSPAAAPAAQPPSPAPPASAGQGAPSPLPPPDSPPLVRLIELRFPKQGDVSVVEPQTYLYYIHTQPSRSRDGFWSPYDEQAVLDDFKRLWATNFLEDLSIDVQDMPYENGVVGKHIIFNMEERERLKIVEYTGSKKIDRSKIDEKLKEAGIQLRLDSFIDEGSIRRVESILRDMFGEKGYQFAEITHELKPMPSGPKLVRLTFTMTEGPKVKIRTVDLDGNQAVSDRALVRQLKNNKPHWWLSWISGRGTYNEAKFEEDADKIVEYYRNKGYIQARVGQPELKVLGDSEDKDTRWVQLRIPITEGERYRVGEFGFDGNTVVKAEGLRPLFKMKPGDWYSEKAIRKGLEKAREVYGSGGYFEFTGYPDLKPRDQQPGAPPEAIAAEAKPKQPIVDVTMRMQEGKQYFINRITFVGNTTTRDNVIRREIRLFEGNIFNTEALKYSIKRLNQLGYFKNLEGGKDVDVAKTPNVEGKVDLTLKLEEQNRNQLTFGAGVSQWEGFFGQLAFQTANFMGRGEALTLSLQAGSRAQNYQLAFTEPFLFDRNITGGFNIFRRQINYISQFTQRSNGGDVSFGFPVADFARMFLSYSYEQVRVLDLNPAYEDPVLLAQNPYLRDSLLIGQGGHRTISKVVPSYVYNTVDNPIFPTSGKRLTLSTDIAGLGGNTSYLKPSIEGVWFVPHTARTSFGGRVQYQLIRPYGDTTTLPIFEKLFQGGEYSIRGYDIRSVGPRDPVTGLVLGGNKSLLFNAEYLITIAGPVRLVLFYDAGQVRDLGQSFGWKEDVTRVVYPNAPLLIDPFAVSSLKDPNAPGPQTVTVGQTSAFKTSTGAEIRFFMPVLNVPFRLIFAYNPQRTGVLDNNLQPAKKLTFRFAVGSTF